jgi:hypothetical protein
MGKSHLSGYATQHSLIKQLLHCLHEMQVWIISPNEEAAKDEDRTCGRCGGGLRSRRPSR